MDTKLELRQIKYFLAVAEDLHFRKAAEKLYISQPGLSKQIKQMESEIGFTLFDRHNRKVSLSAPGQYLQNELSQLLKNLDSIIRHAKLLEQGIEGNLKFGYIGSAMQDVIPNLLLKIRSKFRNIQFDLAAMHNQEQIEKIMDNSLDIGFVRMDRVPRGIAMHNIFEDSFSLVLPKGHKLNHNNFKSLNQLEEEPFILFDPSYSVSYYEKVMQIFENSGFKPLISHRTVHANTIYKLVENNFGVSIVPSSLKKGYNMAIKFIELKKIKERTTLQMIWKKNHRNPILENVLELIN